MIDIVDKVECSACGACEQSCPKGCITFVEDGEGFLYPSVERDLCIECSLCERVCPIINRESTRVALKHYAAVSCSDDIRSRSSSGGIFTLLAQSVIAQGGVVFGARFDERWEVVHDFTESEEGLEPFRVAKYMQSRIGDSFKRVKQFLRSGRKVLFVGTPCQAAGLRRYLGGEHEGLLIVDFVCHGVASPKVWRGYLGELLTGDLDSISHISFRDKESGGEGYNFKIWDDSSKVIYREPYGDNLYMRAMLRDLTLRPSCYRCSSKLGRSTSDITIGDFWGVEALPLGFDDGGGVSLVMLNTDKGVANFSLERIKYWECSYAQSRRLNGGFKERERQHPRRTYFFEALDSVPSVTKLMEQTLRESRLERMQRKMKYIINYILKR